MMAGFIIDGFGGYRYRGWRSLIAYDFGCGTEIPNTASPAFFNLSGKPTAGGQMIGVATVFMQTMVKYEEEA